jgi:hypothetical protein
MWTCLPIYCASFCRPFLLDEADLLLLFLPRVLFGPTGGAYFRQTETLYRLTVALIDLDSPGATALGRTAVLGPALLAAPGMLMGPHLGFVEVENTPFDISNATGSERRGINVYKWAEAAVVNEDYHGVIIGSSFLSSSLQFTLSRFVMTPWTASRKKGG